MKYELKRFYEIEFLYRKYWIVKVQIFSNEDINHFLAIPLLPNRFSINLDNGSCQKQGKIC